MEPALPKKHPPGGPVKRSRAGVTLLEAVIALAVMTVAMSLFSGMVASTSSQQMLNHEFPQASEAAREVLERMRNEDFDEVLALYNADPDDDPGGSGTAPGNRFAVDGFEALPGWPAGLVGEVHFPLVQVGGEWQLREDVEDEALGLPRDLNGDSMIDELDHRGDYLVLPVRVTVDWQARSGPRHIEVFTLFAEFRK